MTPPRPAGATVAQTMEKLRITLPARAGVRQFSPGGSVEHRFSMLAKQLIIFVPIVGLVFIFAMITMISPRNLDALVWTLPVFVAMFVALYQSIRDKRAALDQVLPYTTVDVPGATVEVSAHRLRIQAPGESLDVSLDQIEKVTVDTAGARLRVDGAVRYLLPQRTDDERAWVGGLLKEAVARRKRQSDSAEADRRKLQAIVKKKKT